MIDKSKVRLFMTNILDQAGQVVIIGEEMVEPETKIDVDTIDPNAPLQGMSLISVSQGVKLRHPLRLIANQGTVAVAALFAQEEWAIIPNAMGMELSIHEKILDMYEKYEQEVFGSIIMPGEKKIIL